MRDMEETRATTYALWGLGELTPENASALLDEYIPDNVGAVYRPDRVGREHQGLRNALAWFESPEFLGDGGAIPTTDIIASLIQERDVNGDEVYLLALWPEVPQHEDFDFIQAVQNDGITVLDLSRAMDELDLSLYSRPEPTTEEKAAARAEARAAAKAEKKANKPARTKKKLSDEKPDSTDTDTVITVGVTKPETPILDVETETLARRVMDTKIAMDKAIYEYVDAIVQATLAVTQDRPPFQPDEQPSTTAFFWSAAGGYRVANGKPRRGEEVRLLTDDQIREAGLNV